VCGRCRSPLPENARFCPSCGWPVVPEGLGEERKVVTVLFADLSRSTELASSLDPERFREVLAEFYRSSSDEVVALRGRTEKFVGDAVMAVFGLPFAHEDDALRAVRAGLSIRDRTARIGERLGLPEPLAVRVGVNTGPVVTGASPAGEFLVSGTTVNLSARLQQAAEPGEVLVGDTTWQLTQHSAEFGDPDHFEAKGFDQPVVARPVRSLTPRSSRRTIPLVGRRREMALLTGTFERAREASRAHLVTILGERGIGKGRLVEELLAGLPEGTEVLIGRDSEFHEEPAFAAVADMIRRRLGLEAEPDQEKLSGLLEELVAGCCDPSEVEQVAARLGLLLGLGEERRHQTPYRSAEIRAGLASFLGAMARSAPVVVVLEDLHLARPALFELMEGVLREVRRLPVLVVAVAREEPLGSRPQWASAHADALTIRLEPLGPEDARELAKAAGEALDEETADRVARQAGGNPFFIVETTGMLLHERSEVPHGARIDGMLPPTVQAVVASRLDHLPETARNLFRMASVFPGSAFHESRLALVTEVDPEVLRKLEEEEVIVRDDDRPGRWRFRHELLRDVAYESLSKRDRRRLHERLAEGIRSFGANEHARQIAYHLEEAARAALDLDPADPEPRRKAVAALRRAGDLARWRMEARAAIDLYERALAMAGPEEGWGVEESRILAGMGESRYWLGEYDLAEESLRRALDVGREDAGTRAMAQRFLADILLNIRGQPDRAHDLFDQALEAAKELGDQWAMARTLLMAGWAPYWRDDLDGARAAFEEALRIARANPKGDKWAEARALVALASISGAEGPAAALEIADQALALGREMKDPFTIATANERRSSPLRAMWRLDEAFVASDEAVRTYRDLGARWELASALGDRGTIHRLSGRLAESEHDLRESLALCRELGDRVLVAWTASELATVLLMRGNLAEARELVEDPSLPPAYEGPGDRTAVLWARALVALAEGDQQAGRDLAAEALEIERKQGDSISRDLSTLWTGSFFGPDAVGGERAMDEARERLERLGYRRAFIEPDQVRSALVGVG
jgi:class 3 adenylate cyclase/tetratricopeptide (TPR) repeat protein